MFVTCFFTCANIEYSMNYSYEAPSKGCWYETLRDGEKSHSLRREPFGNWKLPGNHDPKNVGHELHHGLFSNNNGYCPKNPRSFEKQRGGSPKELVTIVFFRRDSSLNHPKLGTIIIESILGVRSLNLRSPRSPKDFLTVVFS